MQLEPGPVRRKAYGCINVNVGNEIKAARMVQAVFPDVEAHAIMKMKHMRRNGVRSYACDIMMPGYLLFRAYGDLSVSQFLTISSVNSILTYDNFDWQLRGDDLVFSKWIFDNSGMIGVSVVYLEGDEIKIADGPLKQIEGKIIRVNKRSRNALVVLGFKQQTFNVWLPFEWMEKADG